jgi:hypothetical protein
VRPNSCPPPPILQQPTLARHEEPERELTDEEIDALPPELPPAKPRKRILPPPKQPAWRKL